MLIMIILEYTQYLHYSDQAEIAGGLLKQITLQMYLGQ